MGRVNSSWCQRNISSVLQCSEMGMFVWKGKNPQTSLFFSTGGTNIEKQQILENAQQAQQLMHVCLCQIQS